MSKTKSKKKQTKKPRWPESLFVEICDAEYSLMIFPDGETVLANIECNDPMTWGTVKLTPADRKRVLRVFRDDPKVVCVGVPWCGTDSNGVQRDYCEQLGLIWEDIFSGKVDYNGNPIVKKDPTPPASGAV